MKIFAYKIFFVILHLTKDTSARAKREICDQTRKCYRHIYKAKDLARSTSASQRLSTLRNLGRLMYSRRVFFCDFMTKKLISKGFVANNSNRKLRERDCATMSVAEVINKHYPALAAAMKGGAA